MSELHKQQWRELQKRWLSMANELAEAAASVGGFGSNQIPDLQEFRSSAGEVAMALQPILQRLAAPQNLFGTNKGPASMSHDTIVEAGLYERLALIDELLNDTHPNTTRLLYHVGKGAEYLQTRVRQLEDEGGAG